jgi:hypothetical protein
MKSW